MDGFAFLKKSTTLRRPLLIGTDETSDDARKTLAHFQTAFFDVRSGDINPKQGWSCVVIDLRLSDPKISQLLSKTLDQIPRDLPRLFVLDRKDRLEIVRANVLGATAIANRPLSAEDAATFLASNVDRHGFTVANGNVHYLAGNVLSDLFGRTGSIGVIDPATLDLAADEIALSLSETGLEAWLRKVREHHQGTMQHCLIVAGVMTRFGQRLGMRDEDVRMLARIGLLHDVGKATVPSSILDKPGKLSTSELAVIRTHPAEGFRLLADQKNVSADELDAVLGHHEYLDGSGYPHGLMNSSVGDITRITTVCDIYGALIERRSYKPEMSSESAMVIVNSLAKEGKVEAALVRALQSSLD